ncbi:hypothetical protein ANA_C11115 [Anabaena sp. 90]|jgi:hypothetical protein|nr:hypothetical protein ANA_C11115 [Anabaena sp. 90]
MVNGCRLCIDYYISPHKYLFTFLYTNHQQLTNNQTITSCKL